MPKVREPRRQICMYTGGTGMRLRTFTVLEFPAAKKKMPYSRYYNLYIVVFNPLLDGALCLVLHEVCEPVAQVGASGHLRFWSFQLQERKYHTPVNLAFRL